jgi:multiple sugar transport system ATP-binding protein
MVFQNYALYPHMSVRQNMSFGLRMRRTPPAEIEKLVEDASQILSIEPLLDRRPRELSGGQRQRVAVGRAIVRKPKAFLFDEPLSNLDAKLRVQMRTELARLQQRLKTTTVYVTHDQVEAMTLGDRIVVMKDGEIQQVDSPLEIYRHPVNRFVAGFIGSPAMNFVEGEVRHGVFSADGVAYPLAGAGFEGSAFLGFRPEHATSNTQHPALAKVTLEVVERMGHETIVYFQLANESMVARLDGNANARPGDQLALHLPDDSWHLFEAGGKQLRV